MNYPLAQAAVMWAKGAWGADAVAHASEQAVPHQTRLAQMNLLSSHDTERLVSMMARPGQEYSQNARLHQGGSMHPAPTDEDRRRARLALALVTLLPGSPMLFAGDEFAMHGPDDPDNRKPVPWPDLGPMESRADAPDLDHLRQVRTVLQLRRDPAIGEALRRGSVDWLDAPSDDVLIFERQLGPKRVLCILNRGAESFDPSHLGVEGTVAALSFKAVTR
jgi:glycosidase